MLPDKAAQKRIWQRVYGSLPKPQPQPRQALLQCRARARHNLQFYRSRKDDPIYGPAYERMAEGCRQEIAMLDRILQK